MFARKGVLNLDGLDGSGADWLARSNPYIEDGKTVVVAPHRVWGPETSPRCRASISKWLRDRVSGFGSGAPAACGG